MAGPKTARLIDDSEYSTGLYQLENDVQGHLDSNEASQEKFFFILQLNTTFEKFGNPFLDKSSDLISFGTNTIASKEQIKCLYEINVAGKQQFKECLSKTVVNNTSSISYTIKNNKI